MRRFALALIALALGACAHNLPVVDLPNSATTAAQARVYVDINGTLFPPNWRSDDVVGERLVRRRHSIYAAINGDKDRLDALHGAELAHLSQISELAADRARVFVFLVGFNTNQRNTAVELRAMQDRIGLTEHDLAIEFYWDGHDAGLGIDAARIWFWGTGSSQVAGQRGLRRVLNAVGDREIIIVSYSRGASVVLSALADPAYSPSFARRTERLTYLPLDGQTFLQADPLRPGPAIRVIMLAPAIGQPDFWAKDSIEDNWTYRELPARVSSIRYSINHRDIVLTKGGIGLADNFNATDLGAYMDAGAELDCHYRVLQGYSVIGHVDHGVSNYIADASFAAMVRDSGVAVRGEPTPTSPAPIVRRDCSSAALLQR